MEEEEVEYVRSLHNFTDFMYFIFIAFGRLLELCQYLVLFWNKKPFHDIFVQCMLGNTVILYSENKR